MKVKTSGYLYAIGKLEPHPTKEGHYVGIINRGGTGFEPRADAMHVELEPVRDGAGEFCFVVSEIRDTIE